MQMVLNNSRRFIIYYKMLMSSRRYKFPDFITNFKIYLSQILSYLAKILILIVFFFWLDAINNFCL